jgi:predicted Rossmann fold nucleotide-binding protein DprA/Smf involved in DNA uptake
MLAPWVRLMEQLAGMDTAADGVRQAIAEETATAETVAAAEQAADSPTDAVLAWLAEHRGPQPITRIRVGVDQPVAEVTAALTELVASGVVIERHTGRRRLWEARAGVAVTSAE